MSENEKSKNLSKDSLALIVGGLFILGLVFAAYTYFGQGRDVDNGIDNDRIEDIIADSDERDGILEENDVDGVSEDVLGVGGPETVWVANSYSEGDIAGSSYTVVWGDTLWEIAEGVYGNGAEWVKILEANQDSIDFLPNGQQALIVPGQVLVLP
jgi:nucleoid-associated protein YgaU